MSIIKTSASRTATRNHRHRHQLIPEHRALDQDDSNFLSDSNYKAYSLAWRFLGLYIDCDVNNDDTIDDADGNNGNGNDDGDGDDGSYCYRKVLWAAYHDANYEGGSIGEYQFYDWTTDNYFNSTCVENKRCVRMDCHEKDTENWQLVGVYKETDGLVDWAEQLFKHQGYCLWDGDKEGDNNGNSATGDYDFMQDSYEDWMDYTGCAQLDNFNDNGGNQLYADIQPQPMGNFTYGIYTDEACTKPSDDMTWNEYIIKLYAQDDYNYGYELANQQEQATHRWNALMNEYKICQPCRAYNRIVMGDDNDNNNDDGDDDDGEYDGEADGDDDYYYVYEGYDDDFVGDDGGGNSEQWGYNCYDDAGYTNCNQCYKFESKTDLEIATTQDLERASAQGTILSIEVGGVQYGEGKIGYNPFHLHVGRWDLRFDEPVTLAVIILVPLLVIAIIAFCLHSFFSFRQRRKGKNRKVANSSKTTRQKSESSLFTTSSQRNRRKSWSRRRSKSNSRRNVDETNASSRLLIDNKEGEKADDFRLPSIELGFGSSSSKKKKKNRRFNWKSWKTRKRGEKK